VQHFKDDILKPFLRVRVSGSDGNRLVREHITSKMTSLGWHVEEDQFEWDTPQGPRQFTNVMATLDPRSKSQLTFGCHYDSKQFDFMTFIGATDSAVSCAMLIDLATCLNGSLPTGQTAGRMKSLQLIFFDGEESVSEWTREDSLYGSRHLAELMANRKFESGDEDNFSSENSVEPTSLLNTIEALILLDLIGTRQTRFANWFPQTSHLYSKLARIELLLLSDGLLTVTEEMTRSSGYNNYFGHAGITLTNGQFPYGVQDDHVPFMERGVPAVHLISYPFPKVWHTKDDNETAIDYPTVENIAAILRVFVADYFGLIA
jgi:glutaminyl-peptide cyclotransferase